jgi:hypothetical protein
VKSNWYISVSHGALLAMFGSAALDLNSQTVAMNGCIAIVCAILSVTHAVKERALEGGG